MDRIGDEQQPIKAAEKMNESADKSEAKGVFAGCAHGAEQEQARGYPCESSNAEAGKCCGQKQSSHNRQQITPYESFV